jgi:hypothetical protein
MNSINIIAPYRNPESPDIWVFDDDTRGLLREPFVGEANTLFDYVAKKLNAGDQMTVFFAGDDVVLPPIKQGRHITAELELKHGCDVSGSIYDAKLSDGTSMENVWLCPALLKYFPKPPKRLTAMVTPHASRTSLADE